MQHRLGNTHISERIFIDIVVKQTLVTGFIGVLLAGFAIWWFSGLLGSDPTTLEYRVLGSAVSSVTLMALFGLGSGAVLIGYLSRVR